MNLITIQCPVCNNSGYAPAGSGMSHLTSLKQPFAYVRCAECKTTYLNPRPSDDDLSACYAQLNDWSGTPASSPANGKKVGWLKSYWRAAAGHLPALPFIGAGPVLDVGCGYGDLLDALVARGIPCTGLEFSPKLVAFCRERGHRVIEGDIRTAELPIGQYETVVLSHVLEHMGDPVGALAKVSKSLLPGGNIVIVVPHVDSPMRYLFGPYWHGWDPPFHLVHFTVPSLRLCAARAGLKLVKHKLAMSQDDLNRSLNLRFGKQKRRLFVRAASLPGLKLLELVGFGSMLTAVLALQHSPESA